MRAVVVVPRGGDEEALREAGLDPSKAKVGERHLLFDLEDEVEARRAVDGKWIPVLQKMSTGQRLIVALSIVMGIAKLRRHNADFIVFDEPVPVLDAECRRAFIKALSALKVFKQVLVVSQDPEFERVASELTLKRKGYVSRVYVLRWDPGWREPSLEQRVICSSS